MHGAERPGHGLVDDIARFVVMEGERIEGFCELWIIGLIEPMARPMNMLVLDEQEPLLAKLGSADLVYLLELPPAEWLGHIISLNRSAQYRNGLDAFALMERLARLRTELTGTGDRAAWE